ncbi:MAG: fenitrothion hydrolase, partial [Solirubrobacteraceae bacterium]
VWSGLTGVQVASANFAPTFVYVVFWLGLVPVSLIFGDVFRALNPWRAIGRAVAGVASVAARGPLPAPLSYPERVGHWPAVAGIFAFAVLEVVVANGTVPETVAIATLVYSAATFVAMALYGVEAWCDRGEAFGVYFNLFGRISPLTRRGDEVGLRRPLSGLSDLTAGPGTVPLLAVMIGTVTFDGASEAPLWTGIVPDVNDFMASLGLSPETALEATFLVGLIGAILLVYGFYRLGIAGARSVGGSLSGERLAKLFVASLVPIALAYVAAHYMTYLLFQGQAISFLASNPLGKDGVDIFGTAGNAIDYSVLGATAVWYWQVAFVVIGHVAALTLAHDRALVVYDGQPTLAVRSQYWMLTVMVGFTCLALLLLSQSNV